MLSKSSSGPSCSAISSVKQPISRCQSAPSTIFSSPMRAAPSMKLLRSVKAMDQSCVQSLGSRVGRRGRARRWTLDILPCLFAKKSQRFDGRAIVERKQYCRLSGVVFVRVPIPQRRDERVALLPIELLRADPGRARAAEGVIDDRVRVAVRGGFLARAQHLDL